MILSRDPAPTYERLRAEHFRSRAQSQTRSKIGHSNSSNGKIFLRGDQEIKPPEGQIGVNTGVDAHADRGMNSINLQRDWSQMTECIRLTLVLCSLRHMIMLPRLLVKRLQISCSAQRASQLDSN